MPAVARRPRHRLCHVAQGKLLGHLFTRAQPGMFFLYLMPDVYSRKIVAREVHETESAEHAAALVARAVMREGVSRGVLVVRQDSGGIRNCLLPLEVWLHR
ncbi:MAG: hypothetical protein ACYDDO_12775 [Acidiferrobacterales bacterium]